MQEYEPGLICQGCYVLFRPFRTVTKDHTQRCPDCGEEVWPELKGKHVMEDTKKEDL